MEKINLLELEETTILKELNALEVIGVKFNKESIEIETPNGTVKISVELGGMCQDYYNVSNISMSSPCFKISNCLLSVKCDEECEEESYYTVTLEFTENRQRGRRRGNAESTALKFDFDISLDADTWEMNLIID